MSNYDITVLTLLFIIALIKCSEFLINTKITLLTTLFALIIVLLIVLFPLSVVIHSIVITGIARTTIVKDNGSDALTITTTTTNNNIIVRTKD